MRRFRAARQPAVAPGQGRGARRRVMLTVAVLGTALTSAAIWVAPAYADGTSLIRNWNNGQCLTDFFGDVVDLGCNGQNWIIATDTFVNSPYSIIEAPGTDECLTATSGTGLTMAQCELDQPDDAWLVTTATDSLGHAVTRFQNASTGGCLDGNGPFDNPVCQAGGTQDWKLGL